MPETRQIKIRPEFAIDPRQQIQIECSGNARGIVICQQLRCDILLQIRSQQQSIAWLQNFPNLAQKNISCSAVKIPNRAPQKKHQKMIAFITPLRHSLQPL